MNTACQLVQVSFAGDVLECVQQDGKVWFSIRRGCENLDIDFASQLTKLRGAAWATVGDITTVGDDGKERALTMIDLDSVPMWLATIYPKKVKEQVREKLARYQKECARVLRDHFFRRPATLAPEQLVALVHDLHAIVNQQRADMAEMQARFLALAEGAPVHIPTNATPRTTVQRRLKFKGWGDTSKKQRAQIRRLANTLLDLRHNETPDVSGGPGSPCVYYGHQIAVLDEAIDEVRETYLQRDRERGPTLFTPVKSIA